MGNDHGVSFSINKLYKDAINGDKNAESDLLQHLTVSFRLFAKHRVWNEHDSEEIVQDALMTIISKYRDIEFETSFAVWAYRVVNNKILNFVKTKQTRKKLAEQYGGGDDPIRYQCPDLELRAKLSECFQKISNANLQHARILNLKYQGYSTEEICGKLKVTRNHMYVMLSRARTALEICLKNGDDR